MLLRKFALLGVILVAFNQSANYQMAAALLVTVVFYALHVRLSPYMSPGQYDAVLREHTMAALTNVTHARLRASIAAVETRGARGGRKRNLVDFQGQIDRTAVLGVLRGWAFDYNSVVASMLFGQIIIILMGILVNLATLDATYSGGTNVAASAVISLVAAVVILYYVAVLIADVLVVFAERSITLKRQAALLAKKRQMGGMGKGDSSEDGGADGKLRRTSSRLSVTAESFVGAMTSDDQRIKLDFENKQRKQEAISGGKFLCRPSCFLRCCSLTHHPLFPPSPSTPSARAAPTETSVNPMFALKQAMAGAASPAKIALLKQEVALSAVDPGELDSHLAALQGFGDSPPPASLWPSVRDAAASALRAQSSLLIELQDLKRALAEARAEGSGSGGGGGGGGPARSSPSASDGAYAADEVDTGAGAGAVLRVKPNAGGMGQYSSRRLSGGAVGTAKRAAFKPTLL